MLTLASGNPLEQEGTSVEWFQRREGGCVRMPRMRWLVRCVTYVAAAAAILTLPGCTMPLPYIIGVEGESVIIFNTGCGWASSEVEFTSSVEAAGPNEEEIRTEWTLTATDGEAVLPPELLVGGRPPSGFTSDRSFSSWPSGRDLDIEDRGLSSTYLISGVRSGTAIDSSGINLSLEDARAKANSCGK